MQNRDENKGVCKAMNNNPYQPQPQAQQSQPQQPQMPVYQQPYVPQMQPQAPKPKLLDREMVGILGCALSAIGLTLAVVSAIVGGNATYVYGLIMVFYHRLQKCKGRQKQRCVCFLGHDSRSDRRGTVFVPHLLLRLYDLLLQQTRRYSVVIFPV